MTGSLTSTQVQRSEINPALFYLHLSDADDEFGEIDTRMLTGEDLGRLVAQLQMALNSPVEAGK